jgi:putative DNA primase/helicase
MRRRLHFIPFLVENPEKERDFKLKEALREEGGGILKWGIEGCVKYKEIGLAPPKSVTEATNSYFESQDTVKNWIIERCATYKDFETKSSALFTSYKDYCNATGLRYGDTSHFKEEMERLGYKSKRTKAGILWLGIQIAQDDPPAFDPGDGDTPF